MSVVMRCTPLKRIDREKPVKRPVMQPNTAKKEIYNQTAWLIPRLEIAEA
jgi:hypothetical protein